MPQSRRMQLSKFWFVLLILCSSRELAAGFFCQPGTPGPPVSTANITNVTTSSTCSEQVQTTNLTQRVDQFTTELRTRLQGGSLLLDQTFAAPFADPAVQSALVSAQQLLTTQGAKGFVGPALLSNTTSLTNSNTISSAIQSAAAQTFVQSTVFVGPVTIQTGVIGQCLGVDASSVPFGCDPNAGNRFAINPGVRDINTNVHTQYFVAATNTTTNTFLTSQVYELDGVVAPVAGIPEPGTLPLAGLAIPGLWLGFHFRRRRETARNLGER